MEEPTKIIREGSRIAVAAFAEFMQAEAGLELNDAQKRDLAERLDYLFHLRFREEVEAMINQYLEEDDDH